MKKLLTFLLMLHLQNASAQVNNNSFEQWDTTYIGTYSQTLNSLFNVANPFCGTISNWESGSNFGLSQTTDSYSGSYAALAHNWYNYVNEWITYNDTLSYRPQFLQGYFKYITESHNGISHGLITVSLTRSNAGVIDTIAKGTFQFDSTLSYSPFQVSLNYLSALNPDSIHIYILNANTPCIFDPVCNLLFIDNLSLTNIPLSIFNTSLQGGDVIIYPNPSKDNLTIKTNGLTNPAIKIYDSAAREIALLTGTKFSTDRLSPGIYTVKIFDAEKLIAVKRFVKSAD